jgi:hypothetical protein
MNLDEEKLKEELEEGDSYPTINEAMGFMIYEAYFKQSFDKMYKKTLKTVYKTSDIYIKEMIDSLIIDGYEPGEILSLLYEEREESKNDSYTEYMNFKNAEYIKNIIVNEYMDMIVMDANKSVMKRLNSFKHQLQSIVDSNNSIAFKSRFKLLTKKIKHQYK